MPIVTNTSDHALVLRKTTSTVGTAL